MGSETKQPPADSNDEVEPIDLWEEEDESEPEIGDGGNGGGVVLHNCPWGQKVLSIAQDVLLQFGDDIEIFAFKTSPKGYIYVRLDRLCNEYGCPSIEDIKSYNNEYKKRLDEAGAKGDIPNDLAVEVSSPGADRLLRIPGDLQRFKDMAMRVKYVENDDPRSKEKEGVYFLDSIEVESESSVWKLADVKENRDPKAKGKPMTRKQKDWRLELPYEKLKQVTLYLDYH
ncbi:ribosome maturation factor RimP [Tanacetum coccineum]